MSDDGEAITVAQLKCIKKSPLVADYLLNEDSKPPPASEGKMVNAGQARMPMDTDFENPLHQDESAQHTPLPMQNKIIPSVGTSGGQSPSSKHPSLFVYGILTSLSFTSSIYAFFAYLDSATRYMQGSFYYVRSVILIPFCTTCFFATLFIYPERHRNLWWWQQLQFLAVFGPLFGLSGITNLRFSNYEWGFGDFGALVVLRIGCIPFFWACKLFSRAPRKKLAIVVDFFLLKIIPSCLGTQLYLAFLALSCENEKERSDDQKEICRGEAQVASCLGAFVGLGAAAKLLSKFMEVNKYNPYPHITANDITSLNVPWSLRILGAFGVSLVGYIIYLVSLLGKKVRPSAMILIMSTPFMSLSVLALLYETRRFVNFIEARKGGGKDEEEQEDDVARERDKSINFGIELEMGMNRLPVT